MGTCCRRWQLGRYERHCDELQWRSWLGALRNPGGFPQGWRVILRWNRSKWCTTSYASPNLDSISWHHQYLSSLLKTYLRTFGMVKVICTMYGTNTHGITDQSLCFTYSIRLCWILYNQTFFWTFNALLLAPWILHFELFFMIQTVALFFPECDKDFHTFLKVGNCLKHLYTCISVKTGIRGFEVNGLILRVIFLLDAWMIIASSKSIHFVIDQSTLPSVWHQFYWLFLLEKNC